MDYKSSKMRISHCQVVISEQEYNELQREKRNAEYLAKLDRSFEQLKKGEVVIKAMEELEAMVAGLPEEL